MTKKLKLLLYRIFTSPLGKIFLRLMSFGVKVNIGNAKKPKKKPFLVAITVDTESGYVDRNERRIWQMEKPDAFHGYYYGIRNLLHVFEKHNVKGTFFLSTQCFSAHGKEKELIKKSLNNLIENKHELGLHPHPDSDFSMQKKLSRKFEATSAFFYDYNEKYNIINAAKEIIKDALGAKTAKDVISFRWGNWALDSDGARALNSLGFKVDSSAVPGIKGHTNDTMRYDWSKVNLHYPWNLSITDYQSTNHNNSKILELPIATFDFFGVRLRADPVNSVLLNMAFTQYYAKADRSEKPFVFVILTHSSEATMKDGNPTKALKELEEFIIFAKKYRDVEFATLKETYKRLGYF